MSITEAFEGVIPATEQPRRPSPRPRPTAVPQPATTVKAAARKRAGVSPVRRLVRVVYLDGADSWIAEERSPSAKTVAATDYTAHLDTVWKPYAVWAFAYRPAAVLAALLLDAIKWLLIHPFRGPATAAATALIYLLATL